MMGKKDKRGRWVKRVQGEYSDKVYSMRLTGSEYQLIKRARDKGIEPRKVLIDTLQDKLKGGGNHASAE
jgi:hypothetical protein